MPARVRSTRRMPPEQTSKAGNIAPELVFMILQHVRHPRDTLPDRPHVLPTLRAMPLVCKAWHHASTEILYQRVLFSSRSSQQSKQLARSIMCNPRLGLLVSVLCFPDLRLRPCDYYRNERSMVRLRNYAELVSLCPNLVFLRLPTNLHNALSPRALPALPLVTSHTEHLLSLHLTASAAAPSLTFLPIHFALPSLLHLTLAGFSLTLDSFPPLSRLLLPWLPRLRSLTLSACLLDARAATQLFTALSPSLTHLELWHSGFLPALTAAACAVLGPTLRTLVVDQLLYELLDHPIHFALPALTSLRIAADALAPSALRQLPPVLERLRITALPICACSACEKWPLATPPDALAVGHALAAALLHPEFEAPGLTEIVLAGRCCAWHKWEHVLQAACDKRGITLVQDVMPGECQDARSRTRQHVDALVRRTSWPVRRVGSWCREAVDRVAW